MGWFLLWGLDRAQAHPAPRSPTVCPLPRPPFRGPRPAGHDEASLVYPEAGALSRPSRIDPRSPPSAGDEGRRAYARYARLGQELFGDSTPPISTNGKSCATCHDPSRDFPPLAAAYPRYDHAHARFQTLEEQILECVRDRQEGRPHEIDRDSRVALQVHLKEAQLHEPLVIVEERVIEKQPTPRKSVTLENPVRKTSSVGRLR